jgi:hypothetical protein
MYKGFNQQIIHKPGGAKSLKSLISSVLSPPFNIFRNMINVYVFPVEGFDRHIADDKLMKAYREGKGVERYTPEGFIEALNDENINIDTHWVKMIDDLAGYYPIAFLHADDLQQAGFNVGKITESDMLTLADKLNDNYLEWMYWESLKIFADHMGIPRLKK